MAGLGDRRGACRRRGCIAPLLLAQALAGGSAAQLPGTGQERVEVRIVEIPLVARDAGGEPVTDLQAGDFTVRSRGRQVDVEYLEPLIAPPAGDAPVPDVKLYFKLGAEYEIAPARAQRPRHFIFLVDVENSDLLDRPRTGERIRRFVQDELPEPAVVAVLSYNGSLNVEESFTDDRARISEALARAFDRPRRPVTVPAVRTAQFLRSVEGCREDDPSRAAEVRSSLNLTGSVADPRCLEGIAELYRDERTARAADFLAALAGTVRIAAGLTSRTTVIAFSHGVGMDPMPEIVDAVREVWGNQGYEMQSALQLDSGMRTEMNRVLDLAVAEGVTFHFVDTLGSPPAARSARRGGIAVHADARPFQAAYEAPQADMSEIAASTGGAFWAERDAFDGLQQVLRFERGRYVLGLSLSEAPEPGRRVPLDIDCRRAGVQIERGHGAAAKSALADTIAGSISPGEPKMQGTDRIVLPLQIRFVPAELGVSDNPGEPPTSLALNLVLQGADGRHLASAYHLFAYRTPASDPGEPPSALALRGGLEGPPGDYRLVASVRNVATGDGGTLVRELHLAAADPTLRTPGGDAQLERIRRSAEQGEAEAQTVLGLLYARGAAGHAVDPAVAAEWLRRAAEQGHVGAQFNLGVLYDRGEGVETDPAAAAEWFRRAAEAGWVDAQVNLGRMYHEGRGVPADPVQAEAWLRRAAEQGDPEAQAFLDRSSAGAADLATLRRDAAAGDAEAQFALGSHHATGEGVAQDPAEAARWFLEAASRGQAMAQYNLGLMYGRGEGVGRSESESARWFRAAAEQDVPRAALELAQRLDRGSGVARDRAEAARWYRRAAEAGLADAQQKLGVLCFRGDGVERDVVEAAARFRLAEAGGNDLAAAWRERAEDEMTPEQTAEAARRAAQGKPAGTE